MTNPLSGECSCGAVQYEIVGPVKLVVNCHCNSCRRRNGSAFSSYAVVAQDDLKILKGGDRIATYQVPEGAKKYFCSSCGSPLYNLNDRYPRVFMVLLGLLSDAGSLVPVANVYCETRLPWTTHLDGMKDFDGPFKR